MYIILGAGIAGCCTALYLAKAGKKVTLIDQNDLPMLGASLHNEGKLHLGYVYAADTSLKTTKRMAEGSLSFLNILSELLSVSPSQLVRSQPFNYLSPNDSMLSASEISQYFEQTDKLLAHTGSDIRRSQPLSRTELNKQGYSTQSVQCGLTTDEFSVYPPQIGALLTAKVMANENITVILKAAVKTVLRLPNGSYSIECEKNKAPLQLQAENVINCLWQNRQKFDAAMGLHYNRPLLTRYKMAITFHGLPDKNLLSSTTFITGPYGDVVNYGDGNYFISWYPACRIGLSKDGDHAQIQSALKNLDKPKLIDNTIRGLAHFYPKVKELLKYKTKAQVGGGYILSWGESDIDDPGSELHKRFQIGFQSVDNWHSLDTGKYCSGPYFAKQLSEHLLGGH
ncbi:NAD(P)/FAD-dependent oxidoreductase [Gilvimarinus sp. 1_MG-2023]|uniref:NAD(P)/FAD-dependent oxidoreductase n=1 Tax=Gilvimarinus sp. 1_MG-2023 TaxID=3062638 RepID=UPI0026E40B59|nr:FAD-dependent oxidoreductase [Gilvimarinus sp. 1_MG-2023]MDO6746264.1 FAD-dependent oxidoreductase [Gilvimarinus sp. 1_MG-2023]